jgi:tetratricopeptide (TPR) repeat protein
MVLSIIAGIIALAAVAAMGFLVAKHWKELRLLDPMSMKEEQVKKQREDMILRRFERLSSDRLEGAKRFGRQFGRKATQSYRRLYRKLKRFEHAYKRTSKPLAAMGPSTKERVKNLLGEARAFSRDLKWADAERRYLEILSLDERNVDAFRGLGQIYLKQKLYPQAKETFEFLQKIGKADDAVFAGLAEIALADGNLALAERMRMKAVDESPKQSHRYAELAEFYVDQDDAEKAWPHAKRASDLEPGSAKYLELSLETAILLGDKKEAKERFQKLRLLIEDQARFQSWKEKIDAIGENKPS